MLGRKFYDALEAVIFISQNSGVKPVSVKLICQNQGVAPRYLEQTMQKLSHSGIIKGTKGPQGGYSLAKEKRRICLLDIYKAVDEAEKTDKNSPIAKIEHTINSNICGLLAGITLQEVYNLLSNGKKNSEKADFSI